MDTRHGMDSVSDCIRQSLRLLARVEAMQKALVSLHAEVRTHISSLQRLDERKPAEPAPPPSADPRRPAAPARPVLPDSHVLAGVLNPGSSQSGDRRSAIRVTTVNKVTINVSSALDDSEPFAGWVVDYSAQGLGVLVSKPVPVSTFITVMPSLPSVKSTRSNWVNAQVKHCRREERGWRLGCQLERQLTKDELANFGFTNVPSSLAVPPPPPPPPLKR